MLPTPTPTPKPPASPSGPGLLLGPLLGVEEGEPHRSDLGGREGTKRRRGSTWASSPAAWGAASPACGFRFRGLARGRCCPARASVGGPGGRTQGPSSPALAPSLKLQRVQGGWSDLPCWWPAGRRWPLCLFPPRRAGVSSSYAPRLRQEELMLLPQARALLQGPVVSLGGSPAAPALGSVVEGLRDQTQKRVVSNGPGSNAISTSRHSLSFSPGNGG